MNHRDKIISTYAQQECKRIANKVISALQKMKDNLQSGEDTILKNIWDEICIQMQVGESFYWDAYLLTIRQTIDSKLFNIDHFIKQVIWIETKYGMEWSFDNEEEETIPICDDDIIDHILYDYVLLAANDYTNKRIEKYHELFCFD